MNKMDCGATDVPSYDSSGKESLSSDNDVPLSKLLTRPHAAEDSSDDEPQLNMKTTSTPANKPEKKENASSRSNGTNKIADASFHKGPLIKIARVSSKDVKKPSLISPKKSVDKNKQDPQLLRGASDDSSDDEPLIKRKTSALTKTPEKQEKKSSRSNGTNNRDADGSSDNEPLIKIARVSSKAAKKPLSVTPKKFVDKNKKESPDDDSSDEPLSEISKKLQSQHQRKASGMPSRKAAQVMKSRRNAARKIVTYAESSSDDWDDEPLATIKMKRTKATKEQKASANNKKTKTKPADKSSKDSSSENSSDDDDDVPLVNLIAKKIEPVKKNAKKTPVSQRSASKKRRGPSNESSDDEPLIGTMKKKRRDNQTKTKKGDTTLKKPKTTLMSSKDSDLSSSSSNDESSTKAAKHPQVTKMVRIILERCDGEDALPTGSLNKTSTETQITEHPTKDDSEGLEVSSEEE